MKRMMAGFASFALVLALTLTAPTAGGQTVSRTRLVAYASSPSAMDTVLADLDRVSAATENDLADIKTEPRSGGWKTSWMFWRRQNARNFQAEQMAASLQRNLRNAMPGLVHDAQSPGGFAPAFKLYNNLSVVCELLDSLVAATHAQDKNESLADDSSALGRIRQQLATQIEQDAAALDNRGPEPRSRTVSSRHGKVKRIVVDDLAPRKKRVKKAASNQQ